MRLQACLCLCAAAAGGCTLPSAPEPPAAASGTAGQAALLGAGAAAGAGIGYALDGRTGALAGGAIGLAGGAIAGRSAASAAGREAVEQARRDERVRIMQRYWNENTLSPDSGAGAPPAPERLDYPAGDYSGINFAPRSAADPSLGEPNR